MRDTRFRYRIQCEIVTENSVDTKILSFYYSLREIEQKKFPTGSFKTQIGNMRILQICSRDQFTDFLDFLGNELYEGDKCMDGNDQIGYIIWYKGKWLFQVEKIDELEQETIDLCDCSFHLRKIGNKYNDGDDNGELKKYYENIKSLDEIK